MGLFNRKPKIGRLAKDANVEGLIKALSYKDKDVRSSAAMALTDVFQDNPTAVITALAKNPQIIEPLITASRDEDETVRWGAVWTMGHFWSVDNRVAEPVIAALKDRDYQVRTAAVRGLGFSDDPQSVGPLIAACRRETNPDVLKAILESLKRLGGPEAEQVLAEYRAQ